MATTNKLDCKIFVEPNVSIADLAQFVAECTGGSLSGPAFGMTITTPVCEIEVRRNPDRQDLAQPGVQGEFLFFRNILELYPDAGSQHTEMVELAGKILTSLWSRGWRAEAACDYEKDLPSRRSNGKNQLIGGTDVIIPAIGDASALISCVRMIQHYWPNARFENAIEDEKYPTNADIPFGRVEELLVYRDADAEKAWDADRHDSPWNSMLYLLLSHQTVTIVVDDPDIQDMRKLLDSIESELSNSSIYAEAA